MDRKISELDQVLNLDEQAEFPLSQDNGGTPTTFKAKLTQLAAKIAEAITFSNLITNDKHIIGAINEAAQGSGASMKFEDLSDVDISDLQNGQFSKYDSTSQKWKNTTIQESDVDNLASDLADKADKTDLVYEKTASGSIATFTDGGDDIPVSEYECEIVAQQASGTPTPDNPLPIIGFDSADISVCGLNIFDEEMEVGTLDNSTGATETDVNKMRSVNFIPVKPNTTYGVYNNTGVNLYIYSYGSDKSFIGFDNTGMVTGSTFTTGSDTHYIKFRTQNNPTYSNNISINYPSSDTQYHAYNGNLYTVAFGQTIYGGRLIYKNGQWSIEATHEYVKPLTLTKNSWAVGTKSCCYRVNLTNISTSVGASEVHGAISNMNTEYPSYFGTSRPNELDQKGFAIVQDGGILAIYDTDLTLSEAQFTTKYADFEVVYPLATPTIIPITSSTRVKTISGVNNIFSNTGDCKLKYFTENADSLAELIKASESESTGDYHEYSTEEKIVGKWIDGRTVYEKTLNVGAIGSGTTFAHGITNLDWIIDYSMFGLYAGENKLVSPANGSSSSIGFVIASWDSTNITFTKGNLSSNFSDCCCTIQYIKSTSNTRSLNLSKGVEETEEKTEEVKEEEKNAEQNER